MNVLGLYDGISCGSVALKNLGIKNNYYASEIDKFSIEIANKNFPEIKQCGDIFKLNANDLPKIDLILGGSPCTHWSIARKKRETTISGVGYELFYQYVRLLRKLEPKYFLYENNYNIDDFIVNKISEDLNVLPVMINSADFSAQNRKRYYWTNIPFKLSNIKSKSIVKDILENNPNLELFLTKDYDYIKKEKNKYSRGLIFCCGLKIKEKPLIKEFKQGYRVYSILGKSSTLLANGPKAFYYLEDGKEYSKNNIRKLSPLECERLQCLPDNYTQGVSNTQRYKSIGNGWTVNVISHILSFI